MPPGWQRQGGARGWRFLPTVLAGRRTAAASPSRPTGTRPGGLRRHDPFNPFRIYTISANGGKPEPVPGVRGRPSIQTWSPDGKRLAFAPSCEGSKEQQHVSIVNLETGAVEAVPGSDNLFSVRWSPDGKWLAALSCDKIWPYVYSFATQKWSRPSAEQPAWARMVEG